ncbi:glycosyltransferase family 2 protein [Roseinatronobacter bogoriensis subsp. barguzinensis]|uniref:Glycosyltransferase family 2 protein n=1 Tax=Roseinatronobacter bogoriensis subsp. barguzinensis TaxID=441209 RepID=A0A2K8KEI8_9RHOB|nr:glycosyltransferase family 2 protein [Rhodobaca barguzinensis]
MFYDLTGVIVADLSTPSVGVVIRTKDRPVFVKRALASVLAQVHRNFHIILVNDGGDIAQLREAIASAENLSLPQDRFTLLDLNPGQGRSAAFNRGVEALSTEFVTCLDDDDTWDAEFLSALLVFFADTAPSVPELGGVGARVTALKEEIIGTGPDTEIRVIGEDSLPPAFHRGEFFLNALAYACYRQDIYPVQWMMRRDAVLQIGGFPENFDVMEDRAFMNRFLSRWRVAILDRKLAYHHRREKRADDRTRNVLLNTLDNPSYDWRYFADLAKPPIDLRENSVQARLLLGIASDLLSEVNYETSAIWQKVDGEMRALRSQLEEDRKTLTLHLENAVQHENASPASTVKSKGGGASVASTATVDSAVFDIWQVYSAREHAQYITPNSPFAERLSISINDAQYGLLMHVSPHKRKMMIQIGDTADWAALELRLDGLAPAGQGLRCRIGVNAIEDYLFETALQHGLRSRSDEMLYESGGFMVHSCDAGNAGIITRDIPAKWLHDVIEPKLSIIFPRRCHNFRFICTHLTLEPLGPV